MTSMTDTGAAIAILRKAKRGASSNAKCILDGTIAWLQRSEARDWNRLDARIWAEAMYGDLDKAFELSKP